MSLLRLISRTKNYFIIIIDILIVLPFFVIVSAQIASHHLFTIGHRSSVIINR